MIDQRNRPKVLYIVYSILACAAVLRQVLEIGLFSLNAYDRSEIGNNIDYYFIYPLSLLLFIYTIGFFRFTKLNIYNVFMISLIYISYEIRMKLDGGGSFSALFFRFIL
ncbi:hypothetical protein HGB13_04440, partial [bacterium]|nr:hypothetical protein [bacterium]